MVGIPDYDKVSLAACSEIPPIYTAMHIGYNELV